MGTVRLRKNLILNVTFEGETQEVAFRFGDTLKATLVEQDQNGFSNIHLKDGSILKGVDSSLFNILNVPVKQIENIEPNESTEIKVELPLDLPASMVGEIVSEQPRPASIEDVLQLIHSDGTTHS